MRWPGKLVIGWMAALFVWTAFWITWSNMTGQQDAYHRASAAWFWPSAVVLLLVLVGALAAMSLRDWSAQRAKQERLADDMAAIRARMDDEDKSGLPEPPTVERFR